MVRQNRLADPFGPQCLTYRCALFFWPYICGTSPNESKRCRMSERVNELVPGLASRAYLTAPVEGAVTSLQFLFDLSSIAAPTAQQITSYRQMANMKNVLDIDKQQKSV